MKKKWYLSDKIITAWIVLGCFIVVSHLVVLWFYGSAINGFEYNGQYFLGNHGEYLEVSKTVWNASLVWGILFYIFIPLTPLGAFVISNIQGRIERRKNRFE